MIYKTIILLISLTFTLTGCSDSKEESTKTKQASAPKAGPQTTETIKENHEPKKVYTLDEIYNHMCIECHSADGSGNTEKLTPTMRNLTQKEIENSLVDVENDDGHVIMEHNRGEIIKMGMVYSAKDMAEYMFKRFSPKKQ